MGEDSLDPIWTVYPQRWWICLAFSLLSASQGAVWITYSVIAYPAIEMYHTTPFMINFLTALGPIAYVPIVLVLPWFICKSGLRFTVVLGAFTVAVSCAIRILARDSSTFWIIILAQTLNACVGPIVMALPPKISAVWFAVDERTTSTAITGMANTFGSTIGFLFGLIVHDSYHIILLVYVQTAATALLALAVILYFPDAPPSPPSFTSSSNKEEKITPKDLVTSMVALLVNRDFMLLALVGGLSSGIFGGWSALLNVVLTPIGYTQIESAWLGFGTTVAAIVAGIVVGRFADKYARHVKAFLLVLFFLSTVSFGWFTVQVIHFIPSNFWLILVAAILASLFLNASLPLFYEMCVEVTFPIPEAASGGFLTLMMNLGSLIFIFAADYISASLINWLTTGAVAFLGLLLIFLRERYKRNDIDTNQYQVINTEA